MKLVGRQNVENGDVFGPYPVTRTASNGGSCKTDSENFYTEADLLREEVENLPQGVNLWEYDHVVYLGTGGTCGLRSYGEVGNHTSDQTLGSSVSVFADTAADIGHITTHELGHNLGMMHANRVECFAGVGFPVIVRVPVSGTCNAVEYGDPYSIMGSGGHVHNTGPHSAMLGFFDWMSTWTLSDTDSWAPNFELDAQVHQRFPALGLDVGHQRKGNLFAVDRCLDSSCTGIQANDQRRFVSLDFRRRTGLFDANLGAGNVDQGLGVIIGPDPNQSLVPQDGTPNTNNFARIDTTTATSTISDGALAPNDWIYDPVGDMTVTAGSVATDSNGSTFISANVSPGIPTASQGTVSIINTSTTASRLQFTAAAGRQNLIKVDFNSAASNYTVTTIHPDGRLTAGSGCTTISQLSVSCPRTSGGRTVNAVNLDLGDENDIGYIEQTVTVAATVNGGAGDDWVAGGRGADTINGGDGNDGASAGGGSGTDNVSGDAGNDTIWGGTGLENLNGGDGNDTIIPGKGARSTLQGGNGTDTVSYVFRSPGVNVSLDNVANDGESGENDNVGDGAANSIENIQGGFGNDTLSGNGSANRIDGSSGSDTVEGHGGSDTLLGGGDTVADQLYGENVSGTLRGTAGNDVFPQGETADGGGVIDGGDSLGDRVEYLDRYNPLTVTIGNGTLDDGESGEGDNIRATVEMLTLGYGNDTATVSSSAGSSRVFTIEGRNGADTLRGGPSTDTINGGAGNDPVLAGQGGDDTIDGSWGDDVVWGDAPTGVTLIGTAGNDVLKHSLGADVFNGGTGTDRVDYYNNPNPVTVTIDGTANDGAVGEKDNVRTDVEDVWGGNGNDTLTGSSAANTLIGWSGNDTINGGDGNDTLTGGDGDDTFNGGNHNDTISGATGNDTLNGGAGIDSLDGGYANDTVNGDAGNDTLRGGSQNDTMNGGADNDTLVADSGADVFEGGSGTDTADYSNQSGPLTITAGSGGANDGLTNGTEGDDVRIGTENVIGGAGADRIVGSSVANRLEGGAAADVLIGNGAADTLIPGAGGDSVWGDSEFNLDLTVVPGADNVQTKDSEADNVDCGGQPTGASDVASVDQTLDILPFLIGAGICESVTY